MKKLKLMTILGTRPEIIRLSAVIRMRRPVLRPYAGAYRPELRPQR